MTKNNFNNILEVIQNSGQYSDFFTGGRRSSKFVCIAWVVK